MAAIQAWAQPKVAPAPDSNLQRERSAGVKSAQANASNAKIETPSVIAPPKDSAKASGNKGANSPQTNTAKASEQKTAKTHEPDVAFPNPNPKRGDRFAKAARGEGDPAKAPLNPHLAKTIAVLDGYSLNKTDSANLKEVVRHSFKGRFKAARGKEKAIKDKVARKVARWYRIRAGDLDGGSEAIEAFRLANPDWPSQKRLRRRAEEALLKISHSPNRIETFFKASGPVTGAGKIALATAYLDSGERAEAAKLIKIVWRNHRLNKKLEALVMKRFGEMLRPKDHKARIDKLLYADRKALIAPALRAAKLLEAGVMKKVKARAAIVRRSRGAGQLLDKLPDDAKKDVGVMFSRIQWHRRNNKEMEAWDLLLTAPQEPAVLGDLDQWWVERRINCRIALNMGKFEIAYRIASKHGPVSGKHYADAKFLAGWIALRFLKRPQTAMDHFLALRTAATDPNVVARAEYWLGRTAAVLYRMQEADEYIRNAARFTHSYYGQIARATLQAKAAQLQIAEAPPVTRETVERLLARDSVMAIGVIRAVGLERLTRLFYYRLARTLGEADEVALVAQLARRLDHVQASVRLAKIALNRGLAVTDYAYPIDVFPNYKRLTDPVDNALLLALSRQESEFNENAKSRAGARGLMQLMPRTARAVARSHKVRYRRSKLTAEPSYNLMLGAAHLRDLLDKYSGSYIKSLAAYNAGGTRVAQWVELFGDPNAPGTDPIDWIERIPFTETRRYIKKIVTAVQVYRARLEGPDQALRILADLNRGKDTSGPASVALEASN